MVGDDSSALHLLCTFISVIAAPSQIIRHQIAEVGDPCC